jgi:hypothetical protein
MTPTTDQAPDKLVEFLYILLRDYIVAGEAEGIMRHHVSGEVLTFSNPYLHSYVVDIAERLKNISPQ